MSNSIVTEMTFKIRVVDKATTEQMSKENIEKAERIVGYKMFNEDGTFTNEAKEWQFDEIFGTVKTLLDMEDIDIIDCTYNKCELIK